MIASKYDNVNVMLKQHNALNNLIQELQENSASDKLLNRQFFMMTSDGGYGDIVKESQENYAQVDLPDIYDIYESSPLMEDGDGQSSLMIDEMVKLLLRS